MQMLFTGEKVEQVSVELPQGEKLQLDITDIQRKYTDRELPDMVSCAVKKNSGDDPDITNGVLVYSQVRLSETGQIHIDGGIGVGRVTRPGLNQPVGEAAINRVPRQMIRKEVEEACEEVGYTGGIDVEISIPEGARLAKETFNPRLGIVDGLSVLGTTGIVRPMSEEAMKDSLIAELDMYAKQGHKTILFVLGGTGETALKEQYGEFQCILQVSNYIGFMIEEAVERGFTDILIGGFVGKLVKVASGTMNTHSHVADGRIETICTHAALHGAPTSVIKKIYDCLTTKAAMKIVEEEGLMDIWPDMAQKASEYCEKTAHKMARVGIIFLDGQNEILAASENIKEVLSACKK